MPDRHWTMPAGRAYGRRATAGGAEHEGVVSVTSVVMVGNLREELVRRPRGAVRGGEPCPTSTPGAAGGVRVAVTSGVWGVRAEHLDALPGLGAVVNFGVGYDTTDVEEATRRGVVVANTPDVLTDCVADTAVGLVIDVMRGLSAADRFVRRGEWAAGRTRPLARRVTGRSRRHPRDGTDRPGGGAPPRGVRRGHQLPQPNAEDRSRHTASSPSPRRPRRRVRRARRHRRRRTGVRRARRRRVLDALGPRGFLVNVARGSVVDEAALVDALEAGRLAGAGLDVFADEPHVPQALLRRDDVVLLPHLASGTVETRAAMADLVLDERRGVPDAGRLVTPV